MKLHCKRCTIMMPYIETRSLYDWEYYTNMLNTTNSTFYSQENIEKSTFNLSTVEKRMWAIAMDYQDLK